MLSNKLRSLLTAVAVALFSTLNPALAADSTPLPFLHPLFADHAVLQRDLRIPIWGWTTPGQKVTVSIGKQKATATADADGKWQTKLGPFKAGGPHTLIVTGPETVTVNDILFGDVWICSGQSNMEMGIGMCNATNDIADANIPGLRLLTVPKRTSNRPLSNLSCQWLDCTPANVSHGGWGGFSAAAFYFGRELQHELKVPIGLIHTSWGGTVAEAWTSAEALQPLHDFDGRLEQLASSTTNVLNHQTLLDRWYQQNDPGTKDSWSKPDADVSAWKKVSMPKPWEQSGLPDYDGIVWFQRAFDLPAAWSGKDLQLSLGPIDDMDTTWVNGVLVGQMNRYNVERSYNVPASALKPGRNVITIRVLDTGGAGGLTGRAGQMYITLASPLLTEPMSLAGEWLMRDSSPLAKMPAVPQVPDANNPNITTVLYNGMISPLLPFGIKGAIWYQGESNAGRAKQYRELLPAMIKDWRNRFQVGDFPFYIVQLAAFGAPFNEPRDNDWAELREAQAFTAKNVPNSDLAVAIDIGEANDIHPKNKREVGRRLALCALAKTYHKGIDWSGPIYTKMEITPTGIRLHFDHKNDGLMAKNGKLTGFAIAGEDRKFVWADATLEGKTILVSSPKVPKPVAVRYGWDMNPTCNLYNHAELPAVPFRTDDWPMITRDAK